MDANLSGLTALVTGASGGIGWAVAEALANEGATLALHAGRRLAELEAKVHTMPWRDRALCLCADITSPAEMEAMSTAFVERLGRLDLCVVNAGIWPPESLPLHEMAVERIREVLDVNLFGAIWTARAFLGKLKDTGPRADGRSAAMVMIGSTAARFGEALHAEYAVSKAGLYGLLRSLKNEIVALDPYARVNLIEPGWTVTPMAASTLAEDEGLVQALSAVPLQQLARTVDIARAVTFLCSPALARHITGEVLTLSGGMEGRRLWKPEAIDKERIKTRMQRE